MSNKNKSRKRQPRDQRLHILRQPRDHHLHVMLTADEWSALVRAAATHGESVAYCTRLALRTYMARHHDERR